jgi:hypothetical protein
MALIAYVCFGAAVLAVAIALAILPSTRAWARWLAGGVIGSYPGVFIFQLLTLPIAACVFALLWLLSHFNTHVSAPFAIACVVSVLVLGVGASLAGFLTGWSVGSAVAFGTPVLDAFASTWAGRLLRRLWPLPLE